MMTKKSIVLIAVVASVATTTALMSLGFVIQFKFIYGFAQGATKALIELCDERYMKL
jgi:hypothetical protein